MKICLVGYGAMGHVVADSISLDDIISGIVAPGYNENFEGIESDVIIDFSHHSNIFKIHEYVKKTHKPVVIATTGYTEDEMELVNDLKNYAPVLYSSNFSLGVILMNRVVREISPILRESFDVELIEKHHNKKADAPSGTAKMLIDSIEGNDKIPCIYGREGASKRKPLGEIGVHSVRGGTIVGEHEVIYAGLDEVFSLKHEAFSKKIFAKGALLGAKWLISKGKGMYDMEDVLFGGKD